MEESIQETIPTSTWASTPRKLKKTPPPQRKPTPIAPRRNPMSKRIASSSRGDGGNEEDERENEAQSKKKKEDEHQGNPKRQVVIIVDPESGYNFDMKVILNNLGAYHPHETHADVEVDQDSDTKVEHIATYVSMKDNSIITDTIAIGIKRNANGEFTLVVEMKEDLCKKIGTLGKQHAIVTNVVVLTKENTS